MKYLVVILALVLGSALLGCGVADTSLSGDATVHSHFYPIDNGVVYTYSRYNNNRYDTISCRFVVGQMSVDKNALIITNTNTPLYYVGFMPDANGNQAAVLERGDTTLLALDGPLVPTATWTADQSHSIQATVVDRYDDYYLPGRLVHFSDVIAVKYHTTGQPDNVYTLRFFARDHGLILERQLALYGEIASLQLISIQYP
jgi:hypothetical protein